MASDVASKGKKRSKAFYRKSSYGGKRQCTGKNILEPGIRGFLVMCHNNESSAVRESYNILNEYGDLLYGPDKTRPSAAQQVNAEAASGGESDEDCEDIEKALKKEVEGIKSVTSAEKRFQNVATKAKNCVFIRTTLDDPVKVVTTVMEDIAQRKLKRARYAARMLPVVGTCKAQTAAITELAKTSLASYFSKDNLDAPTSFTIMFKTRNNNGTTCGKESVIPAIKREVLAINPDLQFSWSEFDVAILVEIVCTVCCLSIAPGYDRLRKYNFQELAQGPKTKEPQQGDDVATLATNSQTSTDVETVMTEPPHKEGSQTAGANAETKEGTTKSVTFGDTEAHNQNGATIDETLQSKVDVLQACSDKTASQQELTPDLQSVTADIEGAVESVGESVQLPGLPTSLASTETNANEASEEPSGDPSDAEMQLKTEKTALVMKPEQCLQTESSSQ